MAGERAGGIQVSASAAAWAASVACCVFIAPFCLAEGGWRAADAGLSLLLFAADLALGAWALEAGLITFYDAAGRRIPLRDLLGPRGAGRASGAPLALPDGGAAPLRPARGLQLFPTGFVPERHAWAVCLFYVLVFLAPGWLDSRGHARTWLHDHFLVEAWSAVFSFLYTCAALVLGWDTLRRRP